MSCQMSLVFLLQLLCSTPPFVFLLCKTYMASFFLLSSALQLEGIKEANIHGKFGSVPVWRGTRGSLWSDSTLPKPLFSVCLFFFTFSFFVELLDVSCAFGRLLLLTTTILFEIGELAVVGSVYSTLYICPLSLCIIDCPPAKRSNLQRKKKFNNLTRHAMSCEIRFGPSQPWLTLITKNVTTRTNKAPFPLKRNMPSNPCRSTCLGSKDQRNIRHRPPHKGSI